MRPKKQPLKLSHSRSTGEDRNRTSRSHLDEVDDSSDVDDQNIVATDEEGTDDASEAESTGEEVTGGQVTEIKERMYLDKLASLKSQLNQLKQGVHPDYNKRLKRLEYQHKERVHLAEVWYQCEKDVIEAEYESDCLMLDRELEERRKELRDTLIASLHDKRRLIETERTSMDITGDSVDLKPLPTRKLRRRPNDPTPTQDKRRKPGLVTPCYQLEDSQVDEDLLTISRGRPPIQHHHQQHPVKRSSFLPDSGNAASSTSSTAQPGHGDKPSCVASPRSGAVSPGGGGHMTGSNHTRIEDNKLFFERKWFHRGQPVFVEMSGETARCSAVITAIQSDVVWVRNTSDNSKACISLSQLQRNHCSIKRRAS